MKKEFWMLLLPVLVLASAAIFAASCGDDDDDDDTGDDAAGEGEQTCHDYVESFFGSDGCEDDETYYDALYDDCQKVDEPQNVDNQDTAWACLDEINCDDYDDALTLYQAVLDCLGPVFQ